MEATIPRDGSGVYSKPSGTTAVSGATVASSPYNTFCDDLVTDANAARPITAGGTGATDAATALSNLGGQASDADLTAIAALGYTAKALLTKTAANTWTLTTIAANVESLLGAADYAAMRTQLGLVIGTNVQAYDADLTTWAGLTPSAYFQTLVDDADAATARTTLGLGTAALKNTGTSGNNVPLLDGANTWSGVQTLPSPLVTGQQINTNTSAGAATTPLILRNANGSAGSEVVLQFNAAGSSARYSEIASRNDGLNNTSLILRGGAGGVLTDGITVSGAGAVTLSSGATIPSAALSSPTLSGTVGGTPTYSGQNTFSYNATTVFNRTGGGSIQIELQTAGTLRGYIGADSTYSQILYSTGGSQNLSIVNATGELIGLSTGPTSVYSLGYRGAPNVGSPNTAYTMVLADAGGTLYHDEVTARTWTIPANASVAFPIGTVIILDNTGNSGAAGSITLSITSDTLRRGDGVSGTGSRTIAASAVAAIRKVASTVWVITGTFT